MRTQEFDAINDPNLSDSECLHIKSETVMRAGLLALSSGMGAYRVKSVMRSVANALGIENHAHITLTEINSTCHEGTLFCTEVDTIQTVGLDSNRITEIGQLTQDIKHKNIIHSVQCINAELERIENLKQLYNTVCSGLFAATACLAFTYLIGGDFYEMILAFFGAFLGQFVRKNMMVRHMNQYVSNVTGVFAAILTYYILLHIGWFVGISTLTANNGYIGALLFVIPGFPLITGGLDLAKLDFSSGIQRLCYAFTIILCATVTGSGFAMALGFSPNTEQIPLPITSPYIILVLRITMSFIAVFAFALMFNSKKGVALTAALIGSFANTFRLIMIDLHMLPFGATIIAAAFVGLLASVLVRHFNFTRITLSVPAIVIMVPGSLLFRGFYDFANGDISAGVTYSIQAFLVLFALPVGLSIARFLTDKKWRIDK